MARAIHTPGLPLQLAFPTFLPNLQTPIDLSHTTNQLIILHPPCRQLNANRRVFHRNSALVPEFVDVGFSLPAVFVVAWRVEREGYLGNGDEAGEG